MNTKHYTSIEMSKRLLELGLNPESADMLWEQHNNTKSYVTVKPWTTKGKSLGPHIIPCWSLGALLELMPLSIVGWDNETYARYFIGNCAEYATGTSKYDKGLISIPSDSMFKCVYSMVCWLLQNNYIKTE